MAEIIPYEKYVVRVAVRGLKQCRFTAESDLLLKGCLMVRYSALGVLFLTLALFGFDGAVPPSLAVAANGDDRAKPGDPPADPVVSRKELAEPDRQIVAREKEFSEQIAARKKELSQLNTKAATIRALAMAERNSGEKELSELKTKAAAWHDALGDGFWKKADPATLGLDPRAVERHRDHAQRSGADAVLVVYKGRIVSEWYAARYKEPIYTMSSVKSWTGLLVGMLIADGKIKSVDDKVSDYLPEWKEGEKAKVTVRHLLTMTSGLKRRLGKDPGPDQSVGYAEPMDKNDFVRKLPLTFTPGERWDYSNEGVQLLSPLLDKAAGRPIQEYARDRLFKPVGMSRTRLKETAKGHAWTYADAETTLRDFARIGVLMLNKGRWGDTQVVP